MDDLNRNLGLCDTFCHFNGLAINNIMQADSLVLFASPALGLMVNGQCVELLL